MAEHISGSEEAFTKRMNDRAKELGMENTQFLNCTGLTDDPGHYTTARDIACMSRALLAHPRIRAYTTIWMDTVRGSRFGLANTNKLIHAYPGATGLKTGYTQQAMHCLSASAERDGVEYIAVVLHAESSKARFADAATLLNFAFTNYSLYSIAANTVIPPVRVQFAETDSVQPVLSGADAIVVRGTAAPQTDIALDEDLRAPGAGRAGRHRDRHRQRRRHAHPAAGSFRTALRASRRRISGCSCCARCETTDFRLRNPDYRVYW